tara:strand:+ start:114 stop:608 length:495 start_codon:yes stop_codon:yes gene_type:complete
MGYFENLNIDNYNLDTDGEVRYIDGALRFVPWMEGVEDAMYKECIKDLLALDWSGYQLYLVGGLLEGWKTTDIDICITGNIGDDLPVLMEEASKLGPFDVYYVKSLDEIKGNANRIWEFAKHTDRRGVRAPRWHGQWKSDGLFWMTEKFNDKGRTYTKEPLALN